MAKTKWIHYSFENNCNVYIYARMSLLSSLLESGPSAGESLVMFIVDRIVVLAVVGILVLDLCNFKLQTNNYTSRIC